MNESGAVNYVDSKSVACDGGSPSLGHPLVYLAIDRRGEIDCPYCGQRYVYDPAKAKEADPQR